MSDKLVMVIMLLTIIFVFGLIFSVRSPERKIIDSPIIWKEDYSNITSLNTGKYLLNKNGLSEIFKII